MKNNTITIDLNTSTAKLKISSNDEDVIKYTTSQELIEWIGDRLITPEEVVKKYGLEYVNNDVYSKTFYTQNGNYEICVKLNRTRSAITITYTHNSSEDTTTGSIHTNITVVETKFIENALLEEELRTTIMHLENADKSIDYEDSF
jgi:hypothetical protein